MEFQIIDVDYVIVNEKPVVRVFGKDKNGCAVCGFFEDFRPYFYAVGEGVEEKLEGNPHVRKTEKVKRCLPMGYREPQMITRVTLKNPAKTVEVRDLLTSMGIATYEADVLYKYRWLTDNGLGGMRWLKTEDCNGISTTSVCPKKCVQMNTVQRVERETDAPLNYLALDIETVSDEENKMPEADKDPVVLISLVFEPEYRGKKSMLLSTKPGNGMDTFGSEKEMLEKFVEIINDYDADVLTGYNINNFDIPYLLRRMEKNRVSPLFGRCKTKRVRSDKFANQHRTSIVGRIIADSFQIVKKDWNLKRYDLNSVGKELLGEEKEDVKKSEIGKLWRGSREDVERLGKYCVQDSVLAMNLLLKRNLLDKYTALAKISGSVLNDILGGGETQRIENYLLSEFNREGFVIPTKQKRERSSNGGDTLKGGFVLEPKKGLHSMVLVLDFKSMYPSLIRSYNICPTTLVKDIDPGKSIEAPGGVKFVPENVRRGIMPKILENMMKERSKVKKQMKTAEGKMKKSLDMKQLAIKVMANAFYGYFGYFRSKIHSMEIAGAITSLGRQTIHNTVDMVNKDYGHEVVYGDTDSVMIKVPAKDFDEAEKIGREMSEKITDRLPGVMELEFEKLFRRFLPLTKKRYMAWSMEKGKDGWKEDIVMKGIETVRRDWCELTSETMRKIIEIILKRNDVKEAVNYFRCVVNQLLDGKIDIEKLVVTKTMTRRPEAYAGVQPHVEVIKKMMSRNMMEIPGVGDRIGYVIVKGTQLVSKRAEDPNFVRENGLRIDSQYYIDNQMLPPLERIFSALGVDREELLGMGKQMGIFEAAKNHQKPRCEPTTVKYEDVNGYICKKCERFYTRPPLTGRCECGGEFLFSSKKGPATKAIAA